MPILDHFGIVAPIYDRVIPLKNAEKFLQLCDPPVVGNLLDAGGGTGRVAEALISIAKQVTVSDLSLGMLRQAKRKNGLHLACAYSEKLPFSAESFERIVMVDALHHVSNQQETADELWRVLKPAGRIVIEEPDIEKFPVKLIALAEKLALMRSHFLSAMGISKLFTNPIARVTIERDGFNVWVIIEKNHPSSK